MQKVMKFYTILIVGFLLAGCRPTPDVEMWSLIKNSQKIEDHRAFLRLHAQSQHASKANAKVKALLPLQPTPEGKMWKKIKDSKQIGDYQTFLRFYPTSSHLSEAQAKITKLTPEKVYQAWKVYQDFEQNMDRAKIKYGNKPIVIEGNIKQFKKSYSKDNFFVSLNAGSRGVNCHLKDIMDGVHLKKGDAVKIRGIASKFSSGLTVTECRVISPKPKAVIIFKEPVGGYKLDTWKLGTEVKENIIRANAKYRNKLITIKGKIKKINYRSYTKQYYLSLESSRYSSIDCYLSNPTAIKFLKTLQTVALKGKFETTSYSAKLTECQLISPSLASLQAKVGKAPVGGYQLTAQKLYKEYTENVLLADSKYKRKSIILSGQIKEIGKTSYRDRFYVGLESGSYWAVRCFLERPNTGIDLKIGQQVTLKGIVQGKSSRIQVNRCDLISPKPRTTIPKFKEPAGGYKFTAWQLFQEFNKNIILSDLKYNNKKITVSGEIKKISSRYVNIAGGKWGVNCYLSNPEDIAKIAKGENVTLAGYAEGKPLAVKMKGCTLQSAQKNKVLQFKEPTGGYKISAYKLYQEFYNNQVRALQKYKNKRIIVSGKIKALKKDYKGKHIILNSGSVWGIKCYYGDGQKTSNLNKGQQVQVTGEIKSYSFGVRLQNCKASAKK
jgi:uncharacterized protein (DUF1330 family)